MSEVTTLELANGSTINTTTGSLIEVNPSEVTSNPNSTPPVRYIEVPTGRDAQQTVTRVSRRLVDLPEPPKTMNTISVILTYALYGLSDHDIAIATGLSVIQVETIRLSDAYDAMHTSVVAALRETDTDEIRSLITRGAHGAVRRLLDGVNSANEAIAIASARDVLDRDGHRPADVVEHRHTVEGGLTIEVVKRNESAGSIPAITLDEAQYEEIVQ